MKLNIVGAVLSTVFFSLGCSQPRDIQEVPVVHLVVNGAATGRILVARDAPPSENHAALELQTYVKKMTNVELPILRGALGTRPNDVLLGMQPALDALAVDKDVSDLGSEGYFLTTSERRLVVLGGQPRGVLYGTYELLERYFGVRWFAPGLETAPKRTSLELPMVNERYRPPLEFREVYWSEVRQADFAARHKLNGNIYQLEPRHGGRFLKFQGFAHTMDEFVPRQLYKSHPELFPKVNGVRIDKPDAQRCLTNAEVIKRTSDVVKKWLTENPSATVSSVSQNDGSDYCQCEHCSALTRKTGSPSGVIVHYANEVAKQVEDFHPSKYIDILAYLFSLPAPENIEAHPNVQVRVSSIFCDQARPFKEQGGDVCDFAKELAAWKKVTERLYVWDYSANFHNYLQPLPNLDSLQPNVKFFVENGVKGVFSQGNMSGASSGGLAALRAYLLSKIFWDPNTDVRRHRKEFLKAYYGPAAKWVDKYIDLLQSQVRQKNVKVSLYDPPTVAYLSPGFLKKAGRLLRRAQDSLSSEHHAERPRVEVLRASIWYTLVAGGHVSGSIKRGLIQQILDISREVGIKKVSEQMTIENWATNGLNEKG